MAILMIKNSQIKGQVAPQSSQKAQKAQSKPKYAPGTPVETSKSNKFRPTFANIEDTTEKTG